MLQLDANGAVIGRARRSDEADRRQSRSPVAQRPSPPDHPDVDRRSTVTHVASVATLRKIASVDEHREATSHNDSASRDYFVLKPETIMTSSAGRAGSKAFHYEQRQRRCGFASPLDLSRDRRLDAPTRRQPEAVYTDNGTAVRRRSRSQSGGSVGSSVNSENRQRTEYKQRAVRDAGSTGREDRHRRLATDSHKEPHHRKSSGGDDRNGNHTRPTVNLIDTIIDVDRRAADDVQQAQLKVSKTEVTSDGEEHRVDGGREIKSQNVMIASSSSPLTDHRFTSSHSVNSCAAPRRLVRGKSATSVQTMWNQIWWPYQEASTDEEESNDDDYDSSDDERTANKDDDDDDVADADDDDTAKAMSWDEIDASFEESIRELDNFLLLQDPDPL